jgi:two-component system, OmpR family, sensor histidine kinase CreC
MQKLSLTLQLFLLGAIAVALAGWVALYQVLEEIKPAVRQSTEETLVDTANLLAEIVAPEVATGTLAQGALPRVLAVYGTRQPDANIWGIRKDDVSHRVYVTDAQGIVLLDSAGRDVGRDYSRWNDVYLTLRGRYGARTTQEIPGDEASTVMYVAAPVRAGERIVGAVTVAKPNRSVQPFIERAQRRLLWLTGIFVVSGLILGGVLSAWLQAAIRRLTRYASGVTAGERPAIPKLPGRELNQLAGALDTMRERLEGKSYVERYVQTLTHELKSPLAGIRSASELLHGEMAQADRKKFLTHIDTETSRLQAMSERLLHLAQVEQQRALQEQVAIPLAPLMDELWASLTSRLTAGKIHATHTLQAGHVVQGERFLVRQALLNLLENALDFTPAGGRISVEAKERSAAQTPGAASTLLVVAVTNDGPHVPGFALPRVTERFYSLPRPGSGRKSTGLGLNFVREVAQLHGGWFRLSNVPDGVKAELALPA